jgi:hypothetical protein
VNDVLLIMAPSFVYLILNYIKNEKIHTIQMDCVVFAQQLDLE